jgi:diguanylate cyclase (GGDEF)-like protein
MEERDRKPLALMMMDLDLFKAINDTYGHGVGDEVLRHFATLVQENVRAADIVGRWGGEEFIVMMPGQTMEEARDGAERVRAAVERATLSEGVRITVSIGLASFHGDDTVDSWIQRADLALYASKASGRNRVSVETA